MNGVLFHAPASYSYGPEMLAAALVTPVVMLLACFFPGVRHRTPWLLALAPIPALAASILAADSAPFVLDQMLVPIVLVLDPPGELLLGASTLLWIAAGAYAAVYLRDEPQRGRFVVCWLLTLTGSIGVFMAADLISFYLAFTLVSLPAYGLIVWDDTPSDQKIGLIYLTVAVLGEAFLIIGFVFLALGAQGHSLLIFDGVAALPTSPSRNWTLALLIAGFGTKIGLAPLHIWMPSTYRAASIPAAAVLSGAAVKAGVIGFIRFLPFDAALPEWGEMLVSVGMFTAFYGVTVGLTQTNAKTILAYSSISQMGLIAAVLGMGLAAADPNAASGAAFYAAHHVLAKGGLFLAIGVVAATSRRQLWFVLPFAAVLALSLGGLPFTGGALAKLAVKEPLGTGVVGTLSALSAIATTLLMARFLQRLARLATRDHGEAAPGLIAPWLVTTAASIAVPWALYLHRKSDQTALYGFAAIWETLWPVLAGVLLAAILWRWTDRLPSVPEGDVLAFGERAAGKIVALGAFAERADSIMTRWAVAASAFLAITIILGVAAVVSR
jgi:multicomponent Na+:H+ antiporter subunit A